MSSGSSLKRAAFAACWSAASPAIDADGVRLADGRVFRAARVVLATGVQPDSRLAAQSGVLCQRGIVVDRQMASSLPGISAIGECCEIDGQTWGLVAPCLRQAEVLADRLCGAPGEGFVLAGRRDPPEGHRH
ncbi:putative nitrite reductase [Klebsiella pneumoniae]|uniref:Putative nitrite reductase n=1 Tax=Klebsiella pneumoniae TaxID=573 RepID=A0A377X9D9_KLEPN|nr:putative nitrite reductase [Klebsiella pneumoniae]